MHDAPLPYIDFQNMKYGSIESLHASIFHLLLLAPLP